MAKNIKSVNLLPEFLRTERNKKFLSSTIDQFIQPAQLERLDGYVGSVNTPTYKPSDVYLSNATPYSFDPALVTNDKLGNIQDVQSYDDLINKIASNGGHTDNLDRLFRSKVYSFNPHIDWDKLVNYQYYYWLPQGPEIVDVIDELDVEYEVIGQTNVTLHSGDVAFELSNGMLIEFSGTTISPQYYNRAYYVEGVGTSISLIPYDRLVISENFLSAYPDGFDSNNFDTVPFDNDRDLPNQLVEYVTINRASKDLNPWSRYNRWVHQDVIKKSAEINGVVPKYPASLRAQRPIVEFKANIKLFNFGSVGLDPIDLFDTVTEDAFLTIEGSTTPVYVDGVELEEGHRVIFNADIHDDIRGRIYEVRLVNVRGVRTLTLQPATDHIPSQEDSVTILEGDTYHSTEWWFNNGQWIFGQQRNTLNQSPLFDLFDGNGNSYGDKAQYLSNFAGNKIFSFAVGTGTDDPYLKFPLAYRNTETIGSILFDNNLEIETIVISQLGQPTYTISTNIAYCKIEDRFENAWVEADDYEMPLIVSTATGLTSFYEEPLSLTNNPLNGIIDKFTISELTDHVKSMVARIPNYEVSELLAGNLRDLPDYTHHGLKLISNANPISFAQMFIGKKEHNLIDAISKTADQYNQFKLGFLNSLKNVTEQVTPADAVDYLLTDLNQNKNNLSPYYLSDMLPYGQAEVIRTWTVTDVRNISYPLNEDFDLDALSLRSVLVYVNGEQLIYGRDYVFNKIDSSVELSIELTIGDTVVVKDYTNTEGAYVPPTPSKLGLYPKYIPSKYLDNTYATPATVIQGHDGSIMLAFNDYRDDIVLELEKRIYNNIKSSYRKELLDFNSVLPGAFRNTAYSRNEIDQIFQTDFVRWAGKYGIDYTLNTTFDADNSKTWNFLGATCPAIDQNVSGSWRSVFKYFYDTDRPHTHPWEMLGLDSQPSWWEDLYGPAPYTSGNLILWQDLADGKINGVENSIYARPGLLNIIPVDEDGNLVEPTVLLSNITEYNKRQPWIAGNLGPAETAWRRSSYWPYALQRVLALTIPATYASLMYDVSRVSKNISNQWTYGQAEEFFRLHDAFISGENNQLTDGYSVMVSEVGKQKDANYITTLRQDLEFASYNLFYKVGGFIDKDTLQIIIDAYDPSSTSPGSALPMQNYKLRLNSGNPTKTLGISGLVIQRLGNEYVVKGYDNKDSYFTCFLPVRNLNTPSVTVGGTPEKYVVWTPSGTVSATGLSATDTISASAAATGNFYQKGQYVFYGNSFYRVTVAHKSGTSFNPSFFQKLPSLPTAGGATVQGAASFSQNETIIPYGTSYSNIQEVYDLIIGYGRWIESQGFIFDTYNSELNSVVDWSMTAKEFLFWSTQQWADGSIITLSPFADQLSLKTNNSVVDNIFNGFYEYGVLRADGSPFPKESVSVTRDDGIFRISTLPNTDGVYFARLNCVQKEHGMVFDNSTIFGDVIFNPETGSRQRRIKLVGFRTANWNGDYFSPGFVYDTANVETWTSFKDYLAGDVVTFNGKYFSALKNIDGTQTFDFTKWELLTKKPEAGLLPNFDYKISQFEEFYSLDNENFDAGQQKMAQHLTGYTPRVFLNNIITNPVSQYKFYQGYIREKGTQNAISKLSKASLETSQGQISYNEEWAFRVGQYGSFPTYQELEVPLVEGTFLENPQVISFVETVPTASVNNLIHYNVPSDLTITPDNYVPSHTFATTSTEDALLLTHAGYVRIDDVTATAYNESSLLDIANSNQLKDGDTIWLGFKQDGSWDVYRYTYTPAAIIGVYVSSPLSAITFTTQYNHNLSEGQLIGVNQFNDQVDGIYVVKSVPNSKQFTVASELASIINAPLEAPGQLYVFESARISDFDSLPSDKELYRYKNGTKFWIDPSETKGWEVYEKINNYKSRPYYGSRLPIGQALGTSISKRKGSNVVVAGAPNYFKNNQYGIVYFYKENDNGTLSNIVRYRLGNTNSVTEFGKTVVYDDITFGNSIYGLVFAGAPAAYNSSGTVKISSINDIILTEGTSTYLINEYPINQKFGSSIFVERNTSTKTVLVGAPAGQGGAVYSYTVSDNNGVIDTTFNSFVVDSSIGNVAGNEWGYSISGTDDASYVAIGAPGYFTGTGAVSIFDKSLSKIETIKSPFGKNCRFGESVLIAPNGEYLFISAPLVENDDASQGKVVVYKNTNGNFLVDQILENPVANDGMDFGKALDINVSANTLAITARGINHTFPTIFDHGNTTFDGGITQIKGTEVNSGAAYLYERQDKRFVLAQELTTATIALTPGTDYGVSIVVDDTEVLVGAPAVDNLDTDSGFYKFDKIQASSNSLSSIRKQDDFVDVKTIQKVTLIDTFTDDVLEYLDVFDPLKGKIPGIAEQELRYKLISDPAIYSIGIAGVNVNTDKNWLDDHVGELWWDLSTAKYLWYEQSDLQYRRNNWGKLFPGATIDVYEWVGSTLLPSEWASQADTPTGLAKGISGQPKFADNSIISVKQVYDSITNSFGNVYYYWVKNKVIVPNSKNRRLSSYAVGSAIADPSAYGLSFASIIDKDAITLSNVGPMLIDNRISINIAQDVSKQETVPPKHTQWLLLQENSSESMPNALLEKKLIDSLLGHDHLGNLVPNPSLSDRTKYGIGIRPQQTMFTNRLEALRNIVEFANSVLLENHVVGHYSFKNLNAQEEIPDRFLGEYDHLVEDNDALDVIDTVGFRKAILDCTVNGNGNVGEIRIVDSGFGYGTLNPIYSTTGTVVGYQGPTFTSENYSTIFDSNTTTFDGGLTTFQDAEVNKNGSNLKISTIVNSNGEIVEVIILNGGHNYDSSFKLIARPQTVIVQSDDTYNGKWTRYDYDYIESSWSRAHTQSYNTPLYWNYVDWASSDYNSYQIYSAVIGSPFELTEITLEVGQYVKVNNGGDGRYIVLRKISDTVRGTYGLGYDIVYSQNGTIQISNGIWDLRNNGLGWDYINTYDQTLFDQTADLELQYILRALKEDIFINSLKVNWNLLFFKAVKYALSEQKSLDWAFKTSFINVVNTAGELNQPPVYKLQNSSSYEQYINEVKPYHTQVRNYTTEYSVIEPTNTEVVEYARDTVTTIKFDRIASSNLTGPIFVTDTFVTTGYENEYLLNWVPNPDKVTMVVKLDGVLILSGDFTIKYYSQEYNGYTKQFARLVLLDIIPETNQVLTIAYQKSGSILNAAERILGYYTATSGMIGLDLPQLMSGIDYPGTLVGGQYEGDGFVHTFGGVYPDSLISGGSWTTTATTPALVSALGINPADIIIDGEYGFLSPYASHAPEEVVPGYVTDSLGISVYTKGASGDPVVMSGNFNFMATSTNQMFVLPELPSTINSISVILGGVILEYTATNNLSSDQFTIDWTTSEFVIPPQASEGTVGYTLIGIGGGSGNTFGIIDVGSFVATGATGVVQSLAPLEVVQDLFVTVNGVPVNAVTTSTDYGYMLSEEGNRATVTVYNLQTQTNVIQVWFFAESHNYFNEIREQVISIDSTSTGIPIELLYSPGNIEPLSAQAIVEITDSVGTRRLLPPDVNYYSVTDPYDSTYPIVVTSTQTGFISTATVRVYKNGQALSPTTDFTCGSQVVSINTALVTLAVGDAIAVETYLPEISGTSTNYSYNYRIEGNNLYLSPGAQDPDTIDITSATIKVITFTNHDPLMIQTERFVGDPNRRFQISRPAINDKYVWVTLFRRSSVNDPYTTYGLINGIDYIILPDNVTVQLDDAWPVTADDLIEVMSIKNPTQTADILGYRMFNDMLGGTTFTRLSKENTTYLTRPLLFTDTEIHVADASVLTPPDIGGNVPGVVIINGERIEFFQNTYTVLSQLRRATLGTGPSEYLEPGTRVLDQGVDQILENPENIHVQNTFTNTLTNIYKISKVHLNRTYPGSTATVRCDGITLSTSTGHYTDQIDVYYGGRQLRKDGMYYHETTATYDNIPLDNIVGTTSTFALLPSSPSFNGAAYLVEDTNKVWVYTGSRTDDLSKPGYVYSGLKYLEPEFTVNSLQEITLNTSVLGINNNIQVSIVKKDMSINGVFNEVVSGTNTLSIIDSNTPTANFLREAPAELPNNNYYGGDFRLTDESGDPLVYRENNADRNLTGYY